MEEPVGPGFIVAPLDADQCQQAMLDGADALRIDFDTGVANTLNQGFHAGLRYRG
ncbi:hypothetical protein HHA01_26620 [Halomonas halmophila]|uniref:Uncharacterized protein n=1 Tax=Halomonas halmophila TaxID=252 RepID=A0A4Y4F4L5_9GAMM|nr:hypothetical protein HHA01_26620 [Halomonas halmophila]